MDNYVITISRKFGSLGHEIAGELGRRLDIPVYDRNAVEAEVRSSGLDVRMEALRQLQASRGKEQSREKQLVRFPWKKEAETEEEAQAKVLFEAQAEVLRSFAGKSSCIILGRGGDVVFRDYDRCLNVYIFAPDQVRLENCIRMLHTDEEAARALIRREDTARDAYRKKFCGHAPEQTYGRHILIDSSMFGVEKSTDILEEAAEYVFDLKG